MLGLKFRLVKVGPVVALGKGEGLCKLNGGGPFLYTPLYHDLSAPAIKRNNVFHK